MKKILILSSIAVVAIVLAGCGNQSKVNPNSIGGMYDLSKSAQEIQKDSSNKGAVTSEDNVDNIYKFYNLSNVVKDETIVKDAISKGLKDGENKAELNEELVKNEELGSAYLLGYTFGCKANGKDETTCQNEMGAKISAIMMEGFQSQINSSSSSVPTVPAQ